MNEHTASRNAQAKRIWGNPLDKAKMVHDGGRTLWHYRGFVFSSRRNPGWGSGVTWFSTSGPGEYRPTAPSKLVLMVKIDQHLADPEAWKRAGGQALSSMPKPITQGTVLRLLNVPGAHMYSWREGRNSWIFITAPGNPPRQVPQATGD